MLARHFSRLIACLLTLLCVSPIYAQTVRIQTRTLGKGTQFRRADLSVGAQRLFTQSLSLWAWDAAPGFIGTLDVHVGARYLNDFGITAQDEGNPFVETERSRFLLDVAELRWRPIESVRLTLGRQWIASSLGVRDVDGAHLRWTPDLGNDVDGRIEGFAGWAVQSGYGTLNSDAWDVQGLPVPIDGSAPGGRRYGFSTGLSFDDAAFDVSWQRRDGLAEDGSRYVGEERIGAAASGSVVRRVALSAAASYHLLLLDVDRADLNLAWREPWGGTVLSGGLEHRQPWFDSSSIFNVFGARPFSGTYVTYQVPVAPLRTSFEARTWARAYDGNLNLGDLGGGPNDARAYGAGFGHDTRFAAFGRNWRWRSYGSWQSSEDHAQGGTQWLGDTRFRVPALRDTLILEGRFLGLRSIPGATSLWGPGGALTAVITAEVPTTFGTFSVAVEGQSSAFYGGNTNAYASFESELWL